MHGRPLRKPHAPCERLGGAQVDVAVAVRVLAQVVLVVVLGCVEAVEGLDLRDDGLGVARLLAAQRRLDGGQVGLVLPVDAAAVLRARVVALAVQARGVHDLEEAVEQHVGGQDAPVVGHGHRLGVARVPVAHVAVAGVLGGAVRVARHRAPHAGQALEECLEPPEAAAGQVERVQVLAVRPAATAFARLSAVQMRASGRRAVQVRAACR